MIVRCSWRPRAYIFCLGLTWIVAGCDGTSDELPLGDSGSGGQSGADQDSGWDQKTSDATSPAESGEDRHSFDSPPDAAADSPDLSIGTDADGSIDTSFDIDSATQDVQGLVDTRDA